MNIFREIAQTTKKDLSKEIRDLLNSNPFSSRQVGISPRNIHRIEGSRTQQDLNRINSHRYRATSLPRR
jgi:hypothetical protein